MKVVEQYKLLYLFVCLGFVYITRQSESESERERKSIGNRTCRWVKRSEKWGRTHTRGRKRETSRSTNKQESKGKHGRRMEPTRIHTQKGRENFLEPEENVVTTFT